MSKPALSTVLSTTYILLHIKNRLGAYLHRQEKGKTFILYFFDKLWVHNKVGGKLIMSHLPQFLNYLTLGNLV